MKPLELSFYKRDTEEVAIGLLGKLLVRKYRGRTYCARIVETEAYLGINDKACHTFGDKRTSRTKSMYLDGGHAYVYLIYGMYHCLNVVTRTKEHPEAVLIRAAEPISGFKDTDKKILAGPGKLCREMKITKKEDGLPLCSGPLWIADDGVKIPRSQLISSPRIGVHYAKEHKDLPLRFYVKDHPSVSVLV